MEQPTKVEPELLKSGEIWYGEFYPDKHVCPPDMTIFSYTAKHLQSGNTYPRQIVCYSQNDFFKLISKWNGAKLWEYVPN